LTLQTHSPRTLIRGKASLPHRAHGPSRWERSAEEWRAADRTGTSTLELAADYVQGIRSFEDVRLALALTAEETARWLEEQGAARTVDVMCKERDEVPGWVAAARRDRLARGGLPLSAEEALEIARRTTVASSRLEGIDLLALEPEEWKRRPPR
jgi:hypothetical protein